MAENDFYDDEVLEVSDEDSGEPNKDSRAFVRKLEQRAKDGDKAKREAQEATREAADAKRELALMKAGIDMDSPTGKLFVKAYDGEITVEAIKAAATEYGLVATSQTPDVQNDLEAINRVSSASIGSSAAIAPSAIDDIRNAKSPEEIMKVLQSNGIGISNEQPGGWVSLV
jgi:hypothetical protein